MPYHHSNQLLDAIPDMEHQPFLANYELIELMPGDVLNPPEERIHYVYFPISCVISVVMPIHKGLDLEIRLIGNEGMLGIPAMLGIDTSPFPALVLTAGQALRIATPSFLIALEQSVTLEKHLKRYLYVLMRQLAQAVACNRLHVVEERLARLLLMMRDRAHTPEFRITQQSLAQMLGVRRVGVTKAARSLQKRNLISYRRGNVRIHDSDGLESASCKCYRIDRETYDHLMR